MSGSTELQTRHDLACLQYTASHRVEVRNDMAISVYSCHDERSVVGYNHPQIRLLNVLLAEAQKRHIHVETRAIVSETLYL